MGLTAAITIIAFWAVHLITFLEYGEVDFTSPIMYLRIIVQAYLFTGLFITAHDSMHGSVHKKNKVNKTVGYIASFLFAGMSYNRLKKNHYLHHKYPGTEKDPDYSSTRSFIPWFAKFMYRYTTISQIVAMAVLFNVLLIWYNEPKLLIFWILPALLSTLQLFYFGTYLPHRKPHTHDMGRHRARTQSKNHLWAMLSCYFFGYHTEHHESPGTPWWQLYTKKSIKQ